MAKRQCFFSFHYAPDQWRAAQVRNINRVDGNRGASDTGWRQVTQNGDAAIQKWIHGQMEGRACTVVLVGANTADRKWINYEIMQSWAAGMGVVGLYVNGLKDQNKSTAAQGKNPFDFIGFGDAGRKLSSVVQCYTPGGTTNQERLDWIREYLPAAVDEAVQIRASYG